MNAIIVDDEPKAIELIKGYLQHFKSIDLAGTFRNGLKAFEFIDSHPVDLVFLDINMPHLSGISLSRMLNPKVKVIFTTAYSQYAVESYEVEAVDYLVKPISFERFARAVSKVLAGGSPGQERQEAVLVKSGAKIFRVIPDNILYLEKDGNYITYHLADQKILARETAAEALANLPDYFVQVHKSYLVNMRQVTTIEKDELTVGEKRIPLGASFREEFLRMLNS